MPVVSHHKIIVLFEGVLSVAQRLRGIFVLVDRDYPFVERKVLLGQLHRRALRGNPERAVEIPGPGEILAEGEYLETAHGSVPVEVVLDADHVGKFPDALQHLRGKVHRRITGKQGVVHEFRYVQSEILYDLRVDPLPVCPDPVRQLHAGIDLLLHAVDPYESVPDLEGVARQGHAALHIVVFLVHRTRDDLSHRADLVPAENPDEGVVVLRGGVPQHRIPVREPEHHAVAPLDLPEALEPAVGFLDKGRIRLLTEDDVVRERDSERSLRNPGAVCELAHEQPVAGIESPLHRRGRNPECLEKEDVDESHDYHREYHGIEPVVPRTVLLPFLIALLPEVPVNFLRDRRVEHDDEA